MTRLHGNQRVRGWSGFGLWGEGGGSGLELRVYWDNGKEHGNYYSGLGFRVALQGLGFKGLARTLSTLNSLNPKCRIPDALL